MDEAAFHRLIRGDTRGPLAALARTGLALTARGYRLGVKVRNTAYDRGWKTAYRAEVPVVSIGNITLGGTGKTPMVEWVARRFRERELRVVILSRGYKGTEGLNDEGRVLDQNLPDVPHLQDRDRVRLATIAVEELEAQVLVLDDGFQHRRLVRDLDIVLLDALDPFGQGRLFPRGLLREPISTLRRASVVVLSRADLIGASTRATIRTLAERWAGPLRWVEARQAPRDVIDAEGGSAPLEEHADKPVAAFCGIGNPEGFRQTLGRLGVTLNAFRTFPDHHAYSAADVNDLTRWAATAGAELVLTTQKDLVKLRTPTLGALPLRALRIGLEVLEGQAILDQSLEAVARRARGL